MKNIKVNSLYFSGLFLCLCLPRILNAQGTLSGLIINEQQKAVANANVLLLKYADSSLVKGIITNEAGIYVFGGVAKGKYIVSSSFSGYRQAYSPVLEIAGDETRKQIATLVLVAEAAQLAKVSVIVKKPLLEQKIDRLVINVAASVTSAGNTALEVLERSPGVVVDHQNNLVSMNGKNGVVLMINGKISHMPMAAMVQLLSGMPAGTIEKIELITTPPAGFDAEGNAGYINIVLKENFNIGTNGSYSGTLGYGIGIITEAAVNLNHRSTRVNLYGDLSYSRIRKPFGVDAYNRNTAKEITTETFFNTDRVDTTRNINARLGLDYQLNKKTVVGILLSGYDNKYTQSEHSATTILKNNITDSVFKLNNSERNRWQSFNGNFNVQHSFSEDNRLAVNVDYIRYKNNQPVHYSTDAFNGAGRFIYSQPTVSDKVTPIHFLVGAIDYSGHISKKLSLETGVKQTISAFNNDVSFRRFVQNNFVKDTSLSANYKLVENYSAAYLSLNVTLDKTTELKAGLRYEYTNSNLGTETRKNIVDRHYGNLFPSVFISHKLDDNNSIGLSYSRRITRPTFNDLAPFTYFAGVNTLLTGNSALQPSISNTVKADYTYKQYLLSVSYSGEKNAIAGFQPESDSVTNKLVLSPKNLIDQKTVSVVVSIPVTVSKWWSMQYSATTLWQEANAIYKGTPVTLRQINYHLNASQSFTLPKSFSAELSAFYQSKELSGVSIARSYGALDVGLKKKMNDKKGAFLFSVGNVFNSLLYRDYSDLPAQQLYTTADINYAQRTFKLTYTRTFGKDKLKEKRDRSTGAEDEAGRVH